MPLLPTCPEHDAMRERLAKGTLLESLRARPPSGVSIRSDAELDRSLDDALRGHAPGRDLHVFGYGSLMWNPALEVVHSQVALVQGWHRRFCLRMLFGRGTPEQPGAMLALDRGGSCRGLLLRIEAAKVHAEARLLWRREMLAGSYDARWVQVRCGETAIRALTFVANRRHARYIAAEPLHRIAHLIRTGKGPLGTSIAYFERTVSTLERLGIRDAGMERLHRVVRGEEV